MWNDCANRKRIVGVIILISVIIFSFFNFESCFNIAYAKSENDELEKEFDKNIKDILKDIDTEELDVFLPNDFNLDFLSVDSFKDLLVKILDGKYFDEYDSLFQSIISIFKNNITSLMKIFLLFLVLVLLYEMFKSFSDGKYVEIKNIVKFIFSLVIITLILTVFKDVSKIISDSVEKIFSFSKFLFPILLNLILISGSASSYSVYSSLSLFLLNTGSYVFTYFLLPLSLSIFTLSIFGLLFSNKNFTKVIDIFKSIFKYTIVIFFAVFGLFSSINLITSGVKDGVSLRLTKFAIKNYIPIIGGYVSHGFDFIHSCSIVVKNAFGFCGILILFFIVLKPLILYFVYMFMFKILSAIIAFIGNNEYSNIFENVSKTMSYFIVVLVGLFFIVFVFIYLLIVSISVV